MAKDLVFESEKLEKKLLRRKWLIPLLVVVIALAVAAAAALLVRGNRGEKHLGGEDTPYPYTWQVNKNGVVTLEIETGDAEGYTWQHTAGGSYVLNVVKPDKQPKGKSLFTIEARQIATSVLTFTLQGQYREDALYEWRLVTDAALTGEPVYISTSEEETPELELNFTVSILEGQGTARQGLMRSGDDSDLEYVVYEDTDGNVVVRVVTPQQEEAYEYGGFIDPYGWMIASTDESVASPVGTFTSGNTASASIAPGEKTGNATVRIYNYGALSQVVLECERTEDGRLIVQSCSTADYEFSDEERAEMRDSYDAYKQGMDPLYNPEDSEN